MPSALDLRLEAAYNLITGPGGRVGTHLVPLLREHFTLRLFDARPLPADVVAKLKEVTAETLESLEVEYEARIVSAHRTPDRLVRFAKDAHAQGIKVIIAGAGGAAHLPGMIASMTHLPVLGVPVQSKALSGMDSLLSIVQMPGGIPVGTLAIGEAGAKNAGLLAAAILALGDEALSERLQDWRAANSAAVGEVPAEEPGL